MSCPSFNNNGRHLHQYRSTCLQRPSMFRQQPKVHCSAQIATHHTKKAIHTVVVVAALWHQKRHFVPIAKLKSNPVWHSVQIVVPHCPRPNHLHSRRFHQSQHTHLLHRLHLAIHHLHLSNQRHNRNPMFHPLHNNRQ